MEEIKAKIQELSQQYLSEIIEIRRHLHAHPELSFEEFNTSEFVKNKLKEYGIPFRDNIVKTGIVALIEGKEPTKKIIALRADLDALPIKEENATTYVSQNVGVMHACGHDAHTASLLGVAKILSELKMHFSGSVKLIFQPGEEKLPGGASLMIKEGVLENPVPTAIFGQHVFPQLPAGKVGFRKGMYMASTDEIYISVKGKGGHAAMPEHYTNPLTIASEIINKLTGTFMNNGFDKRGTSPKEVPTVIAFGKIYSEGGATNVIPDEVKIEGTFRTFDEQWRSEAHVKITSMCAEIAKKRGATSVVNIMKGYPFLVNDETLTDSAIRRAENYLGKENVTALELRMTAEDFAFYSQQMPACFYRLGTGNVARNIVSNVHTTTFDIDEESLKTGMGLMAWLAVSELNNW